jgi:hypothetical protein
MVEIEAVKRPLMKVLQQLRVAQHLELVWNAPQILIQVV